MPMLLLGMFFGAHRPRWNLAPAIELARASFKPLRLAAVVGGIGAVMALGGFGSSDVEGSLPPLAGVPYNACTDGGPVKEYNVSAIDVTMTLNRWGDHVVDAHMYALDANIAAIRQAESELEADRTADEGLDVARVSYGLRKDLIQPMVIRANLGDCLRINFTNALEDGAPASMHILGLPHTVDSAGSAVGENPDTMAGSGQTVQYSIPVPLSRNAERAYYFHDHGAGRRRQNMGPLRFDRDRAAGRHLLRRRDGRPARHSHRQQLGSDHPRPQRRRTPRRQELPRVRDHVSRDRQRGFHRPARP